MALLAAVSRDMFMGRSFRKSGCVETPFYPAGMARLFRNVKA